jgi:hypothetical protein
MRTFFISAISVGLLSASSLPGYEHNNPFVPLGRYSGTTVGSVALTGSTRLSLTLKTAEELDFSFTSDFSAYGSVDPLVGDCENVVYSVEPVSEKSYTVLIGADNECMQNLIEKWNSQIQTPTKILNVPLRFSYYAGNDHMESKESFGYSINVERVVDEIEMVDLSKRNSNEATVSSANVFSPEESTTNEDGQADVREDDDQADDGDNSPSGLEDRIVQENTDIAVAEDSDDEDPIQLDDIEPVEWTAFIGVSFESDGSSDEGQANQAITLIDLAYGKGEDSDDEDAIKLEDIEPVEWTAFRGVSFESDGSSDEGEANHGLDSDDEDDIHNTSPHETDSYSEERNEDDQESDNESESAPVGSVVVALVEETRDIDPDERIKEVSSHGSADEGHHFTQISQEDHDVQVDLLDAPWTNPDETRHDVSDNDESSDEEEDVVSL